MIVRRSRIALAHMLGGCGCLCSV